MRATLNIPDEILSEVQKIAGEKSKTKAIITAMREFIKQKKIGDLIALRGKIKVDYDWQKEEEIELESQKKREKLIERNK